MIKILKYIWEGIKSCFITKNDICDKCNVMMDPVAYDISASLFYYICPKCKKENHYDY